MSNGFLSQDEINSLLNGELNNDNEVENNEELLSDLEKDLLGEVGNISMGSASTALYQLLNQKVNITTPVVTVTTIKQIKENFDVPNIILDVEYVEGISGRNMLMMKISDAAVIANCMMGGDGKIESDELSEIEIPYPEYDAKNLFVRDDNKRNYYLITIKGNKRVDLKDFKNKNNTRRLSFASEQDLMNIMKLIAGSVTPLGLLNDKELKVIFYLDKDFLNDKQIIGVHPNDNTATLWLKVEDLIDIIKEHGNQVDVVEL